MISDLIGEQDPGRGQGWGGNMRRPGQDDGTMPETPATAPAPAPAYTPPTFPEFVIPQYSGPTEVGFDPGPAPQFHPPPSFVPPEFQIGDWQADPGYQFRLSQGTDALQRSAAARGLLQSGGTLQGLINYGQDFASQEYGNVFNRALQSYDRRYQGARDAYNARYKTSQDTYQSQYDPWLAQGNWGNQDALTQYQQGYNVWNTMVQAELERQNQLNQLALGA